MEILQGEWFDLYFRYINGMASLDEFAEWIYHSGYSEEILGNDGYFDYQEFYYKEKYEKAKLDIFLKETLRKYNIENYQKIEVKWILDQILDGKMDLYGGSYILSEFKGLGYEDISPIFIEYVCDEEYFRSIRYSQKLYEEVKRLRTILKNYKSSKKEEDIEREILLIRVKTPHEVQCVENIMNSNFIPYYIKYPESYTVLDIYNGNTPFGFEIYVPSRFYEKAKSYFVLNCEINKS